MTKRLTELLGIETPEIDYDRMFMAALEMVQNLTREQLENLAVAVLVEKQRKLFIDDKAVLSAFREMTKKHIHELEESAVNARKAVARKGAVAMLANDKQKKQAAKVEAHRLWRDWNEGKTTHKSGAAFARFVVDSLEPLDSEESVKRWMREWRKNAKK